MDNSNFVYDGGAPIQTNDNSDVYDPFEQANSSPPTTFWGTTFHIIFITAGSFAFLIPNKFIGVGYATGSVVMLLVFLFYGYTLRIILWCANEICQKNRVPHITYAEVVYEAFKSGPSAIRPLASFARVFILVDFILIWFNASVFVYSLMGDYLMEFVCRLSMTNMSREQIMIFLLVPILAVSTIRRLKYLEPLSILGFICSTISVLPIMYYMVTDESSSWKWPSNEGAIDRIPIFIGAILVFINISGLIIPLRNDMKHPKRLTEAFGVLNTAFMIIVLVYYFFSFIFSAKSDVNIPENVITITPPNLLVAQVSLILYILSLLFIYPLLLYVPFDVIWNDFLKVKRKRLRNKVAGEYTLRVALVIVCFMLAFTNPNLSLFFSISGTVCSSVDSILFPVVIETLLLWKVKTQRLKFTWILIKNSMIFLVGIALVIAGIKDCIRADEL